MSESPEHFLPHADGPPLPKRITLQAVQWMVALQADVVTPQTRSAWMRWHDASPDHARAWQYLERASGSLRRLDATTAHRVLAPASPGRHLQRRHFLGLAAVGALGGAYWLEHQHAWLATQLADTRTPPGESRSLALADDSLLTLDGASAVDLDFAPEWRRVVLRRGRILVLTSPAHSAQAGARPFWVDTPDGRIQALGTRFAVALEAAGTRVQVFAHAVELRPRHGAAQRLEAGQQCLFSADHANPPSPLPDQSDAWTRGMLVADDMPLAEVVAALARYHRGYLSCDPAVAQLPVSGTYPLHDTEHVIDMLTHLLPVRATRLTSRWIRLRPA